MVNRGEGIQCRIEIGDEDGVVVGDGGVYLEVAVS